MGHQVYSPGSTWVKRDMEEYNLFSIKEYSLKHSIDKIQNQKTKEI